MGSTSGETREARRAPTGDTRARCSLVTGQSGGFELRRAAAFVAARSLASFNR